MKLTAKFARYVSQNIMGMVGVSFYIIVDTFFIARAAGADGITVLNLALPIYGIIFAIGSMIGIGSATRFTILKARGEEEAHLFFSNGLFWILVLSIPFVLAGIFAPDWVLHIMGGDADITALGRNYVRIFLIFAPFFMANYLLSGYVRNDGEPGRAMVATLTGSFANIVFDYLFMFTLGLGLPGAALATVTCPAFAIAINLFHFRKKDCTVKFVWHRPSLQRLYASCQLGVAAFIAELSSAVTTIVFNFLILGLAGNIGVAAYGVIANLALVAVAVFNGLSQGTQPLLSEAYGKNDRQTLHKLMRLAIGTSLGIALIVVAVAWGWTDGLIALFNSEKSMELYAYAYPGMRLYFLGYLFACINFVTTGYFSAVARPKEAFVLSISRGVVAIVVCAIVLAHFLGMTGVWLSFGTAELITLMLSILFLKKREE